MFKDIPQFEGKYALTPFGEIYAYPNNRHLGKFKKIQKGGKVVLWKNGKAHNHCVATLLRELYASV